MTIQKTTAKDIVQIIKNKRDEVRFAVLLGAGASVTAGIPSASEMTRELKKRIYDRENNKNCDSEEEIDKWVKEQPWYKSIPGEELDDKEYNAVFEAYANNRPDRRAYVAECVKKASTLNWAHIYLANLVKHNCIQTILTTNFDDLAFKALFQQGQEVVTCHHPDHTKGITFSGDYPLIVHLHGHYLHYDIKNTEKEVDKLPAEFVELFKNVVRENGLIVVGYKGRKEYVTKLLFNFASQDLFKFNLYWVAHGTEGTLSNPARQLLECDRSCLIENCGADTFFLELNRSLDLGFPPYIQDPLGNLVKTLQPLRNLELLRSKELGEATHGWFVAKLERLENFHRKEEEREEAPELTNKFPLLYEQGKIEEAEKQLISAIEKSKEDAFLYFAYGTLLSELGGEENLRQSFEKYKLAVRYNPDYHEAYYNWGNALLALGRMLGRDAGQGLIKESFEKYKLAVKYKSNYHEAYCNWGTALLDLGEMLGGDAGQGLIKESFEKYKLAVTYKPNLHEAYYGWGTALSDLGEMLRGKEGQELIRESFEKYKLAVRYNPDYHEAYYNWGTALSDLGEMLRGKEGQELIRESFEKYRLAVKYKTDDHEAYYNWGNALSALGRMLGGEEGQGLIRESFEKYKLAVKYKPDDHKAYYNWGNALSDLGRMLGGDEGQGLIKESFEKYKLAVKYKPDKHEAYYNWGIATQELADLLPPEEKKEKEALKKQAEELLRKAKDLREKSA